MSDTFTVDVVDLEPWVAKYRNAPRVFAEELGKAGRKSGLLVERRAKQHVPVDTGHLRRSITSTAAPFGTTVSPLIVTTKVGSNLPYAETVEKGRGAGKTAPPTAAIAAWLKRKGGDPRAAWIVAQLIGAWGIEGRPFVSKALGELKPQISAEFDKAKRAAIARIVGGR